MPIQLCRLCLLLALWVGYAWGAPPDYRRIDEHALRAPRALAEGSLDRLAGYLCPSHFSEREKARAIFRWVADRIAYDVEGLRHNRLGSQQAQAVLRERKGVCEGYARLYMALAERAGLQTSYVVGRSHFNGELPFRLPPGVSGHGWNGVLLEGRWQLLDVTWAAGKVDAQGRFQRQFDDFWFCTPPQQFVYTHLPTQQRWQLLEPVWSEERFEQSPRLLGAFFRFGLTLTEPRQVPLRVSGEAVLRWPAPAGVVAIAELRDPRGKVLPGWTFSQSCPGVLETRLRCPGPGNYTLRVYCRKRQAAWQGNLKNPDRYEGVASIPVTASGRSAHKFPSTFGSFQRGGAELLEPWQESLRAGSRQAFRVRAPGASEVALFWGQSLLLKLPVRAGVAEGVAEVPARGVLQVCARYPQESRYWGLVEYRIAPASTAGKVRPVSTANQQK